MSDFSGRSIQEGEADFILKPFSLPFETAELSVTAVVPLKVASENPKTIPPERRLTDYKY